MDATESWKTHPIYGKIAQRLARDTSPKTKGLLDYYEQALADDDAKKRLAYVRDLTNRDSRDRSLATAENRMNVSNYYRKKNVEDAESSFLPRTLLQAGTAGLGIKTAMDANERNLLQASRELARNKMMDDAIKRLSGQVNPVQELSYNGLV